MRTPHTYATKEPYIERYYAWCTDSTCRQTNHGIFDIAWSRTVINKAQCAHEATIHATLIRK